MIIRIVTFDLAGIDRVQYHHHATSVAMGFLEWPGLLAKIWLEDPATGTFGGIYLFEDQAAADASRASELFARMTSNPRFADLAVREFAVIDDLSAVTAGALVGRPGDAAA
jgi:hypothetical protein